MFERAEWVQVIGVGFAAVISVDLLQQHSPLTRTVRPAELPTLAPLGRGTGMRGFAASWLFSPRRQALTLLAFRMVGFALPNV